MAPVRATHECIAPTHLASNLLLLLLRHLLLHHTTAGTHLLLPLPLILSTTVDLLRLLLAGSARRRALLLVGRLGLEPLSLARVVRRALGRGLLRAGGSLGSAGGAGEAAREVPAQLFVDLLLLGAQDADAVADGAACGSWGGLGRGCGRGGMVKMKVGMDGVGGYVPGKALATSSNSAVETWRPMVTSISLFSLAPSHVNFCGWG